VYPPEPHGHRVGSDRVVLGLATVAGLHREGIPEHAGKTCAGTEVGQPVPGKDPCDGDDESVAIRGNRLEQGLRAGLHVAGQPEFPVLVQDTNVHAAGVQGDATLRVMLVGVQAPESLWRRTGHTHGALVKLLEAWCTQKERSHDHRNSAPPCP
jgi:hypothetical protein